jgi:hypothetical protein
VCAEAGCQLAGCCKKGLLAQLQHNPVPAQMRRLCSSNDYACQCLIRGLEPSNGAHLTRCPSGSRFAGCPRSLLLHQRPPKSCSTSRKQSSSTTIRSTSIIRTGMSQSCLMQGAVKRSQQTMIHRCAGAQGRCSAATVQQSVSFCTGTHSTVAQGMPEFALDSWLACPLHSNDHSNC